MKPAVRPPRADAARLLILAVVWVLFFVLADPSGAAHEARRLWEISAGGLGAAGVYALARRWRASHDAALLGALTLALSPLYAALSASFHVDIAAAALTVAALLAFLRGRERRSAPWLAGASVLIALAGLTRQTCFLCAAGGAVALARERRLGAREAAALLGPAALAAAACWRGTPRFPVPGPLYWLRPDVWAALGSRALRAFETASLCLFPLAVAYALRARRAAATRVEKAALVLVGAAALAFWIRARGLALLPGVLHRAGLGALTIEGGFAKDAGWWGSALFWHAAAALALVSSLTFVRAAFSAARGEQAAEIGAAALFCGLPYAAMLALPVHYDRCLLAVLPVGAAAAAAGARGRAWRLAPAFAALLGLALLSSAGLMDYFAWNRALRTADAAAAALGARPEDFDSGRAVAAFSPWTPRAGLTPIGAFPYRSVLAPNGAAVYLYGDAALASAVR